MLVIGSLSVFHCYKSCNMFLELRFQSVTTLTRIVSDYFCRRCSHFYPYQRKQEYWFTLCLLPSTMIIFKTFANLIFRKTFRNDECDESVSHAAGPWHRTVSDVSNSEARVYFPGCLLEFFPKGTDYELQIKAKVYNPRLQRPVMKSFI